MKKGETNAKRVDSDEHGWPLNKQTSVSRKRKKRIISKKRRVVDRLVEREAKGDA